MKRFNRINADYELHAWICSEEKRNPDSLIKDLQKLLPELEKQWDIDNEKLNEQMRKSSKIVGTKAEPLLANFQRSGMLYRGCRDALYRLTGKPSFESVMNGIYLEELQSAKTYEEAKRVYDRAAEGSELKKLAYHKMYKLI